jgi:vancomycin resistance protein VanJ
MTSGGKNRVRPLPQWLIVSNAAYALIIAGISICNAIDPERWWFVAFNLYVPQAIWLIPGGILLLLTLAVYWRLTWLPVAVMAWVAGPLMGFVPRASQPNISRPNGTFIRVMTYNVKWGVENAAAISADIKKYNPDVICMQDSAGVLQTAVGPALSQWYIQIDGQYTVASRLPVSSLDSIDISYPGSVHHCIRMWMLVNGTEICVYTAHLLSPRVGLTNIRHHHVKPMEINVADRLIEGRRLSESYALQQSVSPAPAILMGDLNSPPSSMVIRDLNGVGLRDAFSEAGSGYGYSYGGLSMVHAPYVRIDHIMVNKYFRVSRCWVGNDKGSDHSPLIADLVKVQ